MSEEQRATATSTTTTQSEPDYREPTPKRQAEFRAAYEANVAADKPPYQDVEIITQGELRWILRERGWSGDYYLPKGKQRPDLRGAHLSGADLSGAQLHGANLGGVHLTVANLSGSGLYRADLQSAHLRGANLSGADLRNATLSGTDFTRARMDTQTDLEAVRLDTKTRFYGVAWGGVRLDEVERWPKRLGDEEDIAEATSRWLRINAYRETARAYRNLSIALRAQGLLIPASNYRLREQIMERKASFLSFNLLGWVFSWLLNLVAGYGERPVRSFFAYLLVLFGFAGAYLVATNGFLGFGTGATQVQPLQWYEALVLSVSAFHGRGFFQPVQSLGDPVAILAAIEAVMGLFIEITFIATFTQRFFGGR